MIPRCEGCGLGKHPTAWITRVCRPPSLFPKPTFHLVGDPHAPWWLCDGCYQAAIKLWAMAYDKSGKLLWDQAIKAMRRV